MDEVRALYAKNEHFIKYSLIGCVGVSLDMVSFVVLSHILFWPYQLANAASVSVGITNNFFFNAFFNFGTTDRLLKRYFRFYSVGMIGLVLSAGLLYIFIEMALLNKVLAKALCIVIVALVQFNLNKKYTFKEV
ncbi:MAG: GtrA family protein [Negativicutes bacterium]|nr:GtrA family protein [Negativicutes bacterium]